MLRKTKRKICKIISVLIILWIILVPLRTIVYLLSEFVFCVNTYEIPEIYSAQRDIHERLHIPKRIHQVFFFETSSTLPRKLQKAQQSCIEQHPGYKYTLWNKTMVNALIDREYPDIKDLYNSYGHWVKRADVARYLVLHHHGGWYIDMDIVCKHSVEELSTEAENKGASVVVHTTGPVGFSNDFIGISRRHPFLADVMNALRYSKRWYFVPYASVMFSTGPTFLWGRYLNYPRKEEFNIIENQDRYLHILHGSSWHSVDGVVIWYIFRYSPDFWMILACIFTAISVSSHLYSSESKIVKFIERTIRYFKNTFIG
ncbi:uncharacterized protein LOC123542758 [Mercenaria mercenaria]|uniref:uncharacterized protein LOC123542758 n=1 Tax=Mercenaria mercenaria TaxID=6596 RepID=UPI001E1D9F23|nr:uncharacterized protein LOC123542758 [Mercenaria mercenaria]